MTGVYRIGALHIGGDLARCQTRRQIMASSRNTKEIRNYRRQALVSEYARKVIAWKISQRNTTHLTKGTFKLAYLERSPALGLIYHSDNGMNFTSYKFCKYLKERGVKQSLKEMCRSIAEYMDFYNEKRPHSMIGYLTPNKYEAYYYKRKDVQKL